MKGKVTLRCPQCGTEEKNVPTKTYWNTTPPCCAVCNTALIVTDFKREKEKPQ
jgi:hypothetical protein